MQHLRETGGGVQLLEDVSAAPMQIQNGRRRRSKKKGGPKPALTEREAMANSDYDASLMSSRARLSAFLASARKLASGFSTRIALLRSMPLSFDGAAHDLTSPAGFAPVTSHLRQLNLIERLRLTWSDATQSLRVLNPAQVSFMLVRGGRTACNCSDNFFSCSLFAASCSLAVGLGPFLIHLIGL